MKSGTVSAVSVGFMPIEGRPIATGTRYTRWSLLELSFVSVPANANALVIARAQLSPQGQAKLRYRQLRDEMERTDPEVVRSRARRVLAELQKQGAR